MKAIKSAFKNLTRLGDRFIIFAAICLIGAFLATSALMMMNSTKAFSKLYEMPYSGYYRAVPISDNVEFISEDFKNEFDTMAMFFLAYNEVLDVRLSETYKNKQFTMKNIPPSGTASVDDNGLFGGYVVPQSEYDSAFRRGERILVEGRHLMPEDAGTYKLLIDETVAEINGLSVGDTVDMIIEENASYMDENGAWHLVEEDSVTYEIVGIFQTMLAQPEVENASDVFVNTVFMSKSASANGGVAFGDYDFYVKLDESADAEAFFEFYCSFNDLSYAESELLHFHFVPVDELNAEYNASANTMLMISEIMLGGLLIVIVCATVAFCRVLVSSRRREILIMRALGASRVRVIGQIVCELIMVLVPFSVIGSTVAAFTMTPVIARVIEFFSTAVSPDNIRNTSNVYLNELEMIKKATSQPMDTQTILWLCVIVCAASALITVIGAVIQISRVTKEKQMALLSEGRR